MEIAVGEVVTGEIVLGKLRWGNDGEGLVSSGVELYNKECRTEKDRLAQK